MHEILHIIGLCPDTLTHPNFIDAVVVNYQHFIGFNLQY